MPVDHKSTIEQCISSRGDLLQVVRKVYLSYPSSIFIDDPNIEFDIKEKVRIHFNVGIHCVQIAGSAKTGFSFHQNRDFVAGESDLDLAIISQNLFIDLCENIMLETKSYSNLSGFGRTRGGRGHDEIMKDNIAQFGMILLDLLPSCRRKTHIQQFLNALSKNYNHLFKDITVAVYARASFFEAKQRASLSRISGSTG